MNDWKIFQGNRIPHDRIESLPEPPPWRRFDGETGENTRKQHRGQTFQALPEEVELVNAALYLRRPLLVTGKPGTGKSSLAYAVAYELKLGEVLYWPITTRTTLKDGLYLYDAIARLQDARQQENNDNPKNDNPENNNKDIGNYIQIGPLGTALLPSDKPRVLLVDEIDKSDIDLPNDLLHVFEEGEFEIPELVRLEKKVETATVRTSYKDSTEPLTFKDCETKIVRGRVRCRQFPLVILTSNGERDFPAPFLRRCVRLTMAEPDSDRLEKIIAAHFGSEQVSDKVKELIDKFLERRDYGDRGDLATDQLLNAVYLLAGDRAPELKDRDKLLDKLWKYLKSTEDLQSDS